MRTKISVLMILFICCAYGQKADYYPNLASRNQIKNLPKSLQELKNKTFKFYLDDIDTLRVKAKMNGKEVYYNNAVLNKYFAEVITNYATSTKDLSFSNYFINANSTEKTLTIGKSFRLDNFFASGEERRAVKRLRPIQKVANLLTIYFKSDLSKGFSTLYSKDSDTEEYNFNSNIGVGAKYTYVWNGNIDSNKLDNINFVRDNIVKTKVQKTVDAYVKSTFDKELGLENIDIDVADKSKRDANVLKLIRKKHIEFYEAILDQELSYAKSKKFIESSNVWWYSFEFFFPLTRKKVSYSLDNLNIEKTKFGNWVSKLNLNYLHNDNLFLSGTSVKLTGESSIFNTNTFIANNSTAVSFQNIIQDNGSNQVEGTSSSVFLGEYNDFIATSVKFEAVSLFFNNTIGLSGAIEKRMGDVENTNWKLGIPFSLKDKDDKPTVNFELQWREINKSHTVGISVGYNFGKFVK